MNTFELTLDVDKATRAQPPVIIAQGDRNATTISAVICDHGTLLTQSGLTARLVMRLPDGAHYYRKAGTWSASAGTATVTIDEAQAASAPGTTNNAYFELLSGSTVVYSTSRFTVRVLRHALDGATPPESYDVEVDEAIQRAISAAGTANSAASNANSAASSATTAATSANNAASSANTAANNANSKANAANSAATSATNAASSANSATTSATNAANAANSAATAATNAAGAANTAAGTANTAATNANNKATAANNAATSANTAATEATEAAEDARLAADQARGAISANLRFTLAVREFHDGSQRLAFIDAGEE